MHRWSPTDTCCATLSEVNGKQHLEIWSNRILKRCVDLKALDIHGDVYTDGLLGFCFYYILN